MVLLLAVSVVRGQPWPRSRWQLLCESQKVNSSLTWHHSTCIIHLPSSHHLGILSSHIIPRVSTAQDVLREGERQRAHSRNFNYSILLQLFYFVTSYRCQSLLCLIYKSLHHGHIGIGENRHGGFGTTHSSRHLLGVLEVSFTDKGETTIVTLDPAVISRPYEASLAPVWNDWVSDVSEGSSETTVY